MRPTPCVMTPLGPRVARRCAPGRHAVEGAAPPACQATRRAPREPHPPGTPRTRSKAVPASSGSAQVPGAAGSSTNSSVPSGVTHPPPATDAPVLAWVLAPKETGLDAGASRGDPGDVACLCWALLAKSCGGLGLGLWYHN
jgi:hypothetical protein